MRINILIKCFTRILFLGGVFIPTICIFAQHKIIYSTYLGGDDVSQVTGIEVDEAGNIFVVGETSSKSLPVTEKALEKTLIRSVSTFLQVIDSEGKLIYSTYLNNTRRVIHKIDSEGYVYLTGFVGDIDKIHLNNEATAEPFYSTPNAFQTKTGNRFVMKLDIKQGKVIYSARIGGDNRDETKMDIDQQGNVFLSGTTYSRNFPNTPDALQRTFPKNLLGQNFVTKLSSDGTKLIYSTFLGIGYGFQINDLQVDSIGNVYLVGSGGYFSQSDKVIFPATDNALQPKFRTNYKNYYHGVNGFLLKLNDTGDKILYSTFLGGSYSRCNSIALDQKDNVYVAGVTDSDGFNSTMDAFQTKFTGKSTNSFIVKFKKSLTDFEYSTFFSSDADLKIDSRVLFGKKYKRTIISKIIVDGSGRVFIVGGSNSGDFPTTKNASQKKWGGASLNERLSLDVLPIDAFLSVINPTGNQLVYSTFLLSPKNYVGGIVIDIALDRKGFAYIVGEISSSKFVLTSNAIQSSLNKKAGYLMKLEIPDL